MILWFQYFHILKQKYSTERILLHFFFPEGSLNVVRHDPLSEEEIKLLQKIYKSIRINLLAFSWSSESRSTVTREANIEAALERVRSKTMGMQESNELKDVIQVVYEQFVH